MSRRGPGFAPFPRHGVLRVNDLVPPEVDVAVVRAALAARGIAEGTRDAPVGRPLRALVAPTAAGTLVTLEHRGSVRNPRFLVLRRLTRELDSLVTELENGARVSRNSGQNRTEPSSGGS